MREHDDATRAVHAGDEPGPDGALDPPVVFSTIFAFDDAADAAGRFSGARDGPIYSRWGNPTVRVLERKVAALERAEDAVALASGMGAVHGALTTFLSAGDHVVLPLGAYAETGKLLRESLTRFGIRHTVVDMTRLEEVERAVEPSTRVVFVETPANPTLSIYDIEAVARIARTGGALVVVDNTFATPHHQRPLELGADLVVHSATKAIGGHGDSVGGIVCGSSARCAEVRRLAVRAAGNVMSPMTAWILARGARTLPLRQQRASDNALELARRLGEHAAVATVHHPGLPSHPGHAIARRQMRRGFGSVVALEVAGGVEAGRRAYDRFELIARAVSLGDVRTLATHPATTTHVSQPAEQRRAAGITDGLIRLSVGIEDVEDLWDDLCRALS